MKILGGPWENIVTDPYRRAPDTQVQYPHPNQFDQFKRLWKAVGSQPGELFSIRVTRGILQGDLTVNVSIGPYHLGGHIMWNNENQLEIPAYSHINPEGIEVWEQLKFGPAVQLELPEGSSASANRGPECVIRVQVVPGAVTLLNERTPHDRLEEVTHSAKRMVM
ncbi:hypothetical protein CcaverHIS002_0410470 [Cutaneotrichosporon cavernicola]|nr:hypothetical protein CcaverHIS002_0410470 [Cutaneotrichosporon cavernicola]